MKPITILTTLFCFGLVSLPVQTGCFAAQANQLTVDFSRQTGPVYHGTGFLYGLSEPNVPNANVLVPLKPDVTSQKAPNGLQHPGGDAVQIAGTFLGAGGNAVVDYMQDIYSQFPYQNLGLSDYLPKVQTEVNEVLATPFPNSFVYVPFNEPDNIWYNKTNLENQFFSDWKTVFQQIRSQQPNARLAGPNIANFDAVYISNFLTYCKANACLPDVMTWHELNTGFYSNWSQHYASYRSIETNLGVGPLPINIDEYSTFKDLSVPGELIQWISRFETSKVGAGLAYWHIDDDLDDLEVAANQPNSGWWLYKAYGDMTGSTVQITSPNPNGYGLQGIAALDQTRKQSSAIFGGASGDVTVVAKGLSALGISGDRAHATVWTNRWTGYEGVADPPNVLSDGDYPVKNGEVSVPISNLDPQFSYQLVVAPSMSSSSTVTRYPQPQRYEAEDADVSNGVIYQAGSLANPYVNAASNGEYVGFLNYADSSVTFNVSAPRTGDYQLDIYYGNGNQAMTDQLLRVDGGASTPVVYTPNVDWTFIGKKTVDLYLKAGSHTITLANDTSAGPALLDCIDLGYVAPAQNVVQEPERRYEAEYAGLDSGFRIEGDAPGFSGTGFAESTGSGQTASITFVVATAQDGFYNVRLRYTVQGSSPVTAQVLINGSALDAITLGAGKGSQEWSDTTQDLFFAAGISRITFQIPTGTGASGTVKIDCLDITPINGDTGQSTKYAAASSQNTLSGTAVITSDPYAYSGAYVGYVGNGAGNTLQFDGVNAPASGTYAVAVGYANADRGGASGGSYNLNVIDRGADISVNGGQAQPYYFRNTFGWNCYRSIVLNLPLTAGANILNFGNPNAYAPNFDYVQVAPLTIQTGSYEAEAANNRLTGSATIANDTYASGGKFVTGIGNGPGNKLSFLGVQAPVAGTYQIVIYFAAEADLTATVTANGTAQTVSFPSSRSASLVNTQIAQVQLSAGSNAIIFSNDTGPAPAIDKIEILLPESGS